MVENNRMHERKTVTIPITFKEEDSPPIESHVETLPMTPLDIVLKESYGAIVKNTSDEGLCLITEKKLEPGAGIDVKMVNFTPIPMGENHHSECQAEVIWCNPVAKTEKGTCYEIGVKKVLDKSLPILNWKNPDFGSVKCM